MDSDAFYKWIMETINPIDITVNGPVHSIAYNGEFQVDLIVCPNLAMSKFYFSFGDTGAILGRMCCKHGLKYGQAGLVTSETKIPLSEDPAEICRYFSLNYEQWQLGFATQEEVMQWILGCKFAKRQVFETRKSSDRHNRGFYLKFREYIASRCAAEDVYQATDHSAAAISYFHKEDELRQLQEADRRHQELKTKFHGKLFIDRGVDPKSVKAVMKSFTELYNVEQMSKVEIEEAVVEFIKSL